VIHAQQTGAYRIAPDAVQLEVQFINASGPITFGLAFLILGLSVIAAAVAITARRQY